MMFDLKRPCTNCPFRKGKGSAFCLGEERLEEIRGATAFQCHKTIDYEKFDHSLDRQGDNPQQCAGLMAILHRENIPNQIMQVGARLGFLDPSELDPKNEAYESWDDLKKAHTWHEE